MIGKILDTIKRVIGYFRVSTEKQEDNSSLKVQAELYHETRNAMDG